MPASAVTKKTTTVTRDAPDAKRPSQGFVRPHLEGPEWELVERIALSRGFHRSVLLTNFLLYISHQALTGNAANINENRIGVQVFGRDKQFDRSDDNIVRNYARMLRTRVDDYFQREGSQETLRLHIPRGGYLPVFSSVTQADDIAPVDEIIAVPPMALPVEQTHIAIPPAPRRFLQTGWLVTIALGVGFALAAAQPWNWIRLLSPTARLNHLFWNSLFHTDREAILVPSDGGLVILHRFIEGPTTLRDYVNGDYRNIDTIASGLRGLLRNSAPADLPMLSLKVEALGDRRYTSLVDLDLVTRMSRIANTDSDHLKIRYARDLHMDDLKSSNAVLIGAADANPWVALFEPSLNFQFKPGGSFGGSAVILNTKPLPGEAKTFASITGDPAQRTYGVLAYLPNLEDSGHVLILEGINMAGTQAAGEFLLNPDRMAEVLKRARKPNGELHPFEILLETSSVGANSSQLKILSERISPL